MTVQFIELSHSEVTSFELAAEAYPGTAITGVTGTAATGSAALVSTIALSGVGATASVGTVGVVLNKALTGETATGATGLVAGGLSVPVSGVAAVSAAGLTLTGVLANTATGTLAVSRAVALSGAAATTAAGTVAGTTNTALTGNLATAVVNSVFPDLMIGGEATSFAGQLGVVITRGVSGVAVTASAGTVVNGTSIGLVGQFATGGLYSLQALLQTTLQGAQADSGTSALVVRIFSGLPSMLAVSVTPAVAIAYVLAQDNHALVPLDTVDAIR